MSKSKLLYTTLVIFMSVGLFNLPCQVSAQEKADTEQAGMIEDFFGILAAKGSEAAVSHLYSIAGVTDPVMKEEHAMSYLWNVRQQIQQSEERLRKLKDTYGRHIDYEYVGSEQTGKSSSRQYYLYNFKRAPLLFTFDFYKPEGDEWRLVDFSFDTDIYKVKNTRNDKRE